MSTSRYWLRPVHGAWVEVDQSEYALAGSKAGFSSAFWPEIASTGFSSNRCMGRVTTGIISEQYGWDPEFMAAVAAAINYLDTTRE